MADEHDSWLEGIGVKVGDFFGGAAQAVEDTASSAAQAVSSAAHTAYDAGASAVNRVENAASSVAQTVQSTASSAWNTVGDYANKAVQGVKGAASTAWEGAKEVGRGVEDGVETVVEEVKDAGSAVVEGVEETASSAWDTAKEIGGDVVEGVEEAGSAVWDEAKEVGQDVVNGAKDVVENAEDAASSAWDKTKEVGGEILDGAKEIVDEVEDEASDLYQKGKKVMDDAWKVASDPDQWSGVGTPVRKMLEEEAAQGHKVDARGLSSGELSDAKVIFGDSINYSKVVVDGGSIASLRASRTIGNSIHLTPDLFEPDSSETSTEGKRILVHELTHVWQYQHQGWTYAPKALWAQAKAAIKGDRNGAYDWTRLIGTPFEQWNPEAQAEAVEDYNRALHNVNAGKGTRKDYDNLALLQEYVEKLVAGPT